MDDVGLSKKEGVGHEPCTHLNGMDESRGDWGGGQMRKRSKASSKIIENLDAEHLEM